MEALSYIYKHYGGNRNWDEPLPPFPSLKSSRWSYKTKIATNFYSQTLTAAVIAINALVVLSLLSREK